MRVAERMHEFANVEATLARDQMGQQRIAGDIEGNAEENVRRALIELARKPAVRDVELEEAMAGRQLHALDVGQVPGRYDQPARIGIAFDLRQQPRNLVIGLAVGAGPRAPLLAVDRSEIAVLVGPFVRDAAAGTMRRVLLLAAMAPPWAALIWKAYLPKLYAGQRPADFGEYRDQVVAALRRAGYATAFARTTRTSHAPAAARLAGVTAPVLVVMGEQDPHFPEPRAEADWIARSLRAQIVMVPGAGHYPQSQQPDITAGAILRFLAALHAHPGRPGQHGSSSPHPGGVTMADSPVLFPGAEPAG